MRRLSALAVLAFVCLYPAFVVAEVTTQHILEVIANDDLQFLVWEINLLPAEARRAGAKKIVEVAQQEFTSGREGHAGGRLICLLPKVADDKLLVELIKTFVRDKSAGVRTVAFEALGNGAGPSVESMCATEIGPLFEKLPMLPFKGANDLETREVEANAVCFFECLQVLLRSKNVHMRAFGSEYLELFRQNYSGGSEGSRIVKDLERELRRAGVPGLSRQ